MILRRDGTVSNRGIIEASVILRRDGIVSQRGIIEVSVILRRDGTVSHRGIIVNVQHFPSIAQTCQLHGYFLVFVAGNESFIYCNLSAQDSDGGTLMFAK